MIEGMREVVPDVQIDVEYAAAARWYKSAKERRDADGNLLLWEPAEASVDTLVALAAPV